MVGRQKALSNAVEFAYRAWGFGVRARVRGSGFRLGFGAGESPNLRSAERAEDRGTAYPYKGRKGPKQPSSLNPEP